MNKPEQQRRICLQQDSSQPVAANNAATIDHLSAAADRIKDLDTHPGITIKWSLDSASRRQIGLLPAAAVGAVASRVAGVGGGSC
jgi:hypothetical protein